MSLIIPYGPNVKFKKFEGNPWFNLVALVYLNRKFNNHCVIIPTTEEPEDHTDVSIRWIQKNGSSGYIHVPERFWEVFNMHLGHSHDKGFIVFPFGFTCRKAGHANFLLYNIKTKTLERFDSLGKSNGPCIDVKGLDQQIQAIFKNKMGNDFIQSYIPPFTGYKIFQELQDEENSRKLATDPKYGFCSVWACWWADLRLSNPNIDRDTLIELALGYLLNGPETLTQFIRRYSQNLVQFSEKMKIKLRSRKSKRKRKRS